MPRVLILIAFSFHIAQASEDHKVQTTFTLTDLVPRHGYTKIRIESASGQKMSIDYSRKIENSAESKFAKSISSKVVNSLYENLWKESGLLAQWPEEKSCDQLETWIVESENTKKPSVLIKKG